jgi:hypothetical protein
MKRIWIAGLCVAGVTIPVTLMTVFLFGCCVLPFHRGIHRVFPICGGIVKLLTPQAHDDAIPTKAAPKPSISRVIFAKRLPGVAIHIALLPPARPLRPIDRRTQSAMRCDDDVGLHLLLAVLLI